MDLEYDCQLRFELYNLFWVIYFRIIFFLFEKDCCQDTTKTFEIIQKIFQKFVWLTINCFQKRGGLFILCHLSIGLYNAISQIPHNYKTRIVQCEVTLRIFLRQHQSFV